MSQDTPEELDDVGQPAHDPADAIDRAKDDLGLTDEERRKVSAGGGECPDPASDRGQEAQDG